MDTMDLFYCTAAECWTPCCCRSIHSTYRHSERNCREHNSFTFGPQRSSQCRSEWYPSWYQVCSSFLCASVALHQRRAYCIPPPTGPDWLVFKTGFLLCERPLSCTKAFVKCDHRRGHKYSTCTSMSVRCSIATTNYFESLSGFP